MPTGIRIGRVAGISVYLDWSLSIIFFLLTFSLAVGVFPRWHPDWEPGVTWGTAIAAAILFLASVFIHELSHALMGRAHGIEIKRITLFIFGGMAHLEQEPHAWRAELWMAIVGPITSLVLGATFLFLGSLITGPLEVDSANAEQLFTTLSPLATLLFWLGPVNIILGLFNLVPGFPLDGGRVLRALLWGISGNFRQATQWASRAGQFFAWTLIITGFAMILGFQVPFFGTGLVGGLWLAFIGWFLNNAAVASYQQLLVQEALEDIPVSRLMQTDFVKVNPDMRVRTLVEEHLMRSDQRAFPVEENNRLAGIISIPDIRKISREKWSQTTIGELMTPVRKVALTSPKGGAAEALFILARRNINQLPVVENGQIRGLIRREDLLKWLSLHGKQPLKGLKDKSTLPQ
ncbi:site-2 protease family protein [Nitrosococcus oceani]|uniref:Zinc metalloprotease n=2 Tax=Nitrosococcus oceani TaxID=1229 RepID=Q3JCC7_NITOC|nr:site-2 protease family protein [Nitrosococcus oceani]KFI20019.1 peptidase M50 [Nitrosococcus oceani C-27]ABA57519.1 Peptidase M50 [Nitrosococcus oceani ATCC 19707]EDZ66746.1 peptidase, M50 family protein [Nitrosococcus oceani AFC27]KFI23191.1 peptidase M50 [Nitrosococcus oceani]GEM20691.1 peptidase M50 [Nitrosococcus oceani]